MVAGSWPLRKLRKKVSSCHLCCGRINTGPPCRNDFATPRRAASAASAWRVQPPLSHLSNLPAEHAPNRRCLSKHAPGAILLRSFTESKTRNFISARRSAVDEATVPSPAYILFFSLCVCVFYRGVASLMSLIEGPYRHNVMDC